MRSSRFTQIAQIAVILAVAFGLKYFYSISNVNDLRWILAPTTFLVELITGTQFRFESQAGYLSDDRTFLIAQPCSGVNFLIIAFVMLAVGKLWRERHMSWLYLPAALLVAYIATLVANTTRIAIALELRKYDLGFDYEQVHRIEGIVVYFGFLLLLFLASESIGKHRRGARFEFARRSLLPLAVYYAVTLGVPLARGAYNEPEFVKHLIVVLAIPALVMLPIVIVDIARVADSSSDQTSSTWQQ